MNSTFIVRVCAAVCFFINASLAVGGGPLNPPVGAITSTAKPLSEVEPRTAINATNTPGTATCVFRISSAGSYYLTGNVVGVAAKNGIEIAAAGVTLDLNGFQISGAGPDSLVGVLITQSSGTNITVKNGSIRNWGSHGTESTYNFGNPTTGVRFLDVQSSLNRGNGFDTWGKSVFARCVSLENEGTGFYTVGDDSISDCTAGYNTLEGFYINGSSTLSNCTAAAMMANSNPSTASGP